MRRSRAWMVFLILVVASAGTLPAAHAQFEEIVSRARPAVVKINVETTRATGNGTGFFVREDGFVVTARHVVEGSDRITVVTPDGREHRARVVRASDAFDAAVLKIDGTGFPTLPLAEAGEVAIGQEILVLGFPFGAGRGLESFTVTRGIISALRPSEGLVQIDAAVNPGNSGGPVVNRRGQVVGLAIARQRDAVLASFAVAADRVRALSTNLSAVAEPPRSTGPSAAPPARVESPPRAGAAGAPAPTGAAPWRASAGQSFGPVPLGMPRAHVEALLGPPDHVRPNRQRRIVDVYYTSLGLNVEYDGTEVVSSVTVGTGIIWDWEPSAPTEALRSWYATDQGTRLGDPVRQVIAAHGRPRRVETNRNGFTFMFYTGLLFIIDDDDETVTFIVVLPN